MFKHFFTIKKNFESKRDFVMQMRSKITPFCIIIISISTPLLRNRNDKVYENEFRVDNNNNKKLVVDTLCRETLDNIYNTYKIENNNNSTMKQ